jgi:hypothetical protein
MKFFRLLMIVVVMLTFSISSTGSARADAPVWEMGYVPLVTQLDPALSLEMQAQNALEPLMPILFLEKKNGALLEYQPELGVGILMLKYAVGKRPATLAAMQVFDDIHTALAVVPQPQRVHGEAAAASHVWVRSFLYDSCFYMFGLLPGNYVTGSLYNGNQQVIAVSENTFDGNGDFNDCFQSQGSFVAVLPGYQIKLMVYSSNGGALQETLTSFVPSIKFTSLDRVNRIARGKGPAGKAYQLCWQYRSSANVFSSQCKSGSISNTRDWLTEFVNSTPVRFRGGDGFAIYVDSNVHFNFLLQMWFPYAQCYLGDNYCQMYGFAGQSGFLTVTRVGTPYTLTGTFDVMMNGIFKVPNDARFPITLKAGDQISGTNITSHALPNLTGTIHYATDVVSGKAPANSYFSIDLFSENLSTWYEMPAHSDAAGNYSVNFSSKVDLKTTDTIFISIDYWNNLTGNQTNFSKYFGP